MFTEILLILKDIACMMVGLVERDCDEEGS